MQTCGTPPHYMAPDTTTGSVTPPRSIHHPSHSRNNSCSGSEGTNVASDSPQDDLEFMESNSPQEFSPDSQYSGHNGHLSVHQGYSSSPDLQDAYPPYHHTPVRYSEPLFWCSIKYYEFSDRVGEPCNVNRNQFTVDGFTDPSSGDRFCLGTLSNVNRLRITEDVRASIGKGVHIYRTDGDVYIENTGSAPVFVQSQSCNLHHRFDTRTVLKVPPTLRLQVFYMEDFIVYLQQQIALARGKYRAIHDMMSLCNVRLSFVKGWGQDYPRKRVTEVPCWIEIFINGPSQMLDEVLHRVNPCSEPCDSK